MIDHRIPLMGEPINVLQQINAANRAAAVDYGLMREKQIADMYQEYGPSALRGNAGALEQLATIDPFRAAALKGSLAAQARAGRGPSGPASTAPFWNAVGGLTGGGAPSPANMAMPGDPPSTPDRTMPVQPGEFGLQSAPSAPVARISSMTPQDAVSDLASSALAQRFEGPASPHSATAGLGVAPVLVEAEQVTAAPQGVEVAQAQGLQFGPEVQPTGGAMPLPMGQQAGQPEAQPSQGEIGLLSQLAERYGPGDSGFREFAGDMYEQIQSIQDPRQRAAAMRELQTMGQFWPQGQQQRQMTELGDGNFYWTDTLNNPDGPVPVRPGAGDPEAPGFGDYDDANKTFRADPVVKDFAAQSGAYGRILSSAQDPTAAGDLALIFNYMKLLDPGSVVRESEFATAANAAGVPEQVRAQWNRLQTGERLGDNQRSDFVDRSHRLYKGAESQFQSVYDQYARRVSQFGMDPEKALTDYRYAAPQDGERVQEAESNDADPLGIR